jgi:hypothetical protein
MRNIVKILIITLSLGFLTSCSKDESTCDNCPSGSYQTTDGVVHNTYLGPSGGCYYINSNGNKTYVDRSYCN